MKVKCNECGFESNYDEMINHAKKTKHWDEEINKIPNCHFLDDNEVIELYRKNIVYTMKVNTLADLDSFFEAIECDRKDFKNIHPDMTTDILDKYGRKKLVHEVFQALQNNSKVDEK
ncbi:MAG: hypothetical protein AABW67_00600 [Nanoarchaeota archaeon]